ncbi:hypothetical protein ABW09_00020 [Pluralibacter gergoviae]|nr:hypothetical protein ABW09_00020 [Pluralibacter gergoviae]
MILKYSLIQQVNLKLQLLLSSSEVVFLNPVLILDSHLYQQLVEYEDYRKLYFVYMILFFYTEDCV